MNVKEVCRDTTKLNPLVDVMLELAIAYMIKQGVNPLVIETLRSQERQNYLYCQGRTIAECMAKGINSTFAKAYCNPSASKVTWTLNSVHVTCKAVDVVPQRLKNKLMLAIWDSNDAQTRIIIKAMMRYGFESGANWSTSPDSPHFQVKGDFENVFDSEHNTIYVTKAIQKALKIKDDGDWGNKTTDAVNAWRKSKKWKETGSIGAVALKALLG